MVDVQLSFNVYIIHQTHQHVKVKPSSISICRKVKSPFKGSWK